MGTVEAGKLEVGKLEVELWVYLVEPDVRDLESLYCTNEMPHLPLWHCSWTFLTATVAVRMQGSTSFHRTMRRMRAKLIS